MNTRWDAVVIGAGPAGMNAAYTMAEQGLQVALVDEQQGPGGQIFRDITHPDASQRYCDTKTFVKGTRLVERFLHSSVKYFPGTTVWMVEPHQVFCVRKDQAFALKTRNIVVAVGAMERPVPFAGWTLPGVMLAGAADVLLKGGGGTVQGATVLAGSGPLLLLVATHLLAKGAKLDVILDMTPPGNLVRSVPWLPAALLDMPLLLDGARMLLQVKRSGVSVYCNVQRIAAHGTEHVEEVSFTRGNKEFRIPVRNLLFHAGMIPRTHMARALRLPHRWDERQQCWIAKYNIFGASRDDSIHVVGDCARVRGEAVAAIRGELAGLKIASSFGTLSKKEFRCAYLTKYVRLMQALSARTYIDTFFSPRTDLFAVPDDVVVCRCEHVLAGDIRKSALEGLADVNEVKLRTRAGMGICQGRTCGAAAAAIAAAARSMSVQSMGALSVRNPLRAFPLEILLTLEDSKNQEKLCR